MIIAKPFDVTLDTKQVKPLRDKSWQTFIGDSVILNIKILEDGNTKPFDTNSVITVLYTNNINTIEQKSNVVDSGISIVDCENGVIQVKPKDNYLSEGFNIITVSITDEDENITLQQFIFNTLSTVNDAVIIESKDDIETLTELARIIEDFPLVTEELDKVSASAEAMITTVNDKIVEADSIISDSIEGLDIEVHEALVSANLKVDDELGKMQDRIDNKNNELDIIFLKSVELEKTLISNKIVFSTAVIGKVASELVKHSYLVHINTSPYVSGVTTQFIGLLTFSIEATGVNCLLNTLSNKSVQGQSIQVTCQFSNGFSVISNLNETGYKIVFKTNGISSSLGNSKCVLTPISSGLL